MAEVKDPASFPMALTLMDAYVRVSASARFICPDRRSVAADSTLTGDVLCRALRLTACVPVTIRVSPALAAAGFSDA